MFRWATASSEDATPVLLTIFRAVDFCVVVIIKERRQVTARDQLSEGQLVFESTCIMENMKNEPAVSLSFSFHLAIYCLLMINYYFIIQQSKARFNIVICRRRII